MSLLEDGFKEYVALMADWYSKGLIYKDFYADATAFFGGTIQQFADGKVAVGESTYDLSGHRNSCPDYMTFAAIPYPVKTVGDVPHVRQSQQILRNSFVDSFSTSCTEEDLEILMKYCDYSYSEEGQLFANWGTEGLTFEYGEDGKPYYTDLIMKNPDGLTFLGANAVYLGGRNQYGVYEWTRELVDQSTIDCVNIWYNADDDWVFPEAATTTLEEGNVYAATFSDIQTLASENVLAFIIGAQPMSEWDAFIEQVNSMGVDECANIKQASLDRYYNRLSALAG